MPGTVSNRGVPIITLSIAGQEWAATIDTGFNGDLELSEVLRNVLKPEYVGKVTSSLAGGQTIEEDVYLVEFPFDGDIVQARATFVANGEILIGTHYVTRISPTDQLFQANRCIGKGFVKKMTRK